MRQDCVLKGKFSFLGNVCLRVGNGPADDCLLSNKLILTFTKEKGLSLSVTELGGSVTFQWFTTANST